MIYRYKDNMGSNPASVNIRTGVVSLNRDIWDKLTDYEKAIILLHEEGHYRLKTLDEIRADIYSIDKYLSDADTPEKRRQLLNTVFKIVPDEERRVQFVKNLLQYDEVANANPRSTAMLQAINDYEAGFAVGTALAITDTVLKVVSYGISFWQQVKNKETFWKDYPKEKKEQLIEAAGRAAIDAKYLSTGNDYGAVKAAAALPASDKNSLWCDAFTIIAAGAKFDPKEFDNRQSLTVGQASGIWWSKQGYGANWMSDWVDYRRQPMQEVWDSMSFFEKVQVSNKYKFYLLAFVIAAIAVYKLA